MCMFLKKHIKGRLLQQRSSYAIDVSGVTETMYGTEMNVIRDTTDKNHSTFQCFSFDVCTYWMVAKIGYMCMFLKSTYIKGRLRY